MSQIFPKGFLNAEDVHEGYKVYLPDNEYFRGEFFFCRYMELDISDEGYEFLISASRQIKIFNTEQNTFRNIKWNILEERLENNLKEELPVTCKCRSGKEE